MLAKVSRPQMPGDIATKLETFISTCASVARSQPAVVVMAMHELARNLYPSDPFIPFPEGQHRLDALDALIPRLTAFVAASGSLGSYRPLETAVTPPDEADVRKKTGSVYGKLWARYPGDLVKEAADIVVERFEKNAIPLDVFKGKTVLDSGCGAGRYSCALAKLGAAKVIGLDFGDDGLEQGRRLAEGSNISNVEFVKGDLRSMPFEDASFDFVFSNGVAHHTGDIRAVASEIARVLKPDGQTWFFIYGAGGVFWHARRVMNEFMKNAIPQDYALRVLDIIGMPMNRFIFADNWYVPIEEHTSAADFEGILADAGFSKWRRCVEGRSTDFDWLAVHGTEKDKAMWGDGQLRYLAAK